MSKIRRYCIGVAVELVYLDVVLETLVDAVNYALLKDLVFRDEVVFGARPFRLFGASIHTLVSVLGVVYHRRVLLGKTIQFVRQNAKRRHLFRISLARRQLLNRFGGFLLVLFRGLWDVQLNLQEIELQISRPGLLKQFRMSCFCSTTVVFYALSVRVRRRLIRSLHFICANPKSDVFELVESVSRSLRLSFDDAPPLRKLPARKLLSTVFLRGLTFVSQHKRLAALLNRDIRRVFVWRL